MIRRAGVQLAGCLTLLMLPCACSDPLPTQSTHREPIPTDTAGPHSLAGKARISDWPLVVIDDERLWYRGTVLQSFDYPQDSAGVVLFEYDGQFHYHPVQIGFKALAFADNFRRTGDTAYLGYAERSARRLLAEAERIGGALYFPYTYDFDLHGIPGERMEAVWYSGMAEGVVLSLLVRLFGLTGDESYREAADAVAASFLRVRGDARTYTSMIDSSGYYWIEEYPMREPTGTLNGFIFGLYGAYEYWRLTGDPEIELVIHASTATLKHYLPRFRVSGGLSYYCLKHLRQIEFYHTVHVGQLRDLERITGDPYFGAMADSLMADVRPSTGGPPGRAGYQAQVDVVLEEVAVPAFGVGDRRLE